jgi:diaminopimelate epimerase
MNLNFSKMHSLGNDFVIINNLNNTTQLSADDIKYIATRKYGVGCDQLLIINKPTHKDADFDYTIFNTDGTLALQCGNGARCVIFYLVTQCNIKKKYIVLNTKGTLITGKFISDTNVSVNLGVPNFYPDSIPFLHHKTTDDIYSLSINRKLINFGVCSIGNPHILIRLPLLKSFNNKLDLQVIGAFFQTSRLFPDKVNVNFYYVIDRNTIQLVTYERGCGFTLACGTGACASVAYAALKQEIDKSVTQVKLVDGGSLTIAHAENDAICLAGEVHYVYDGQITL